MDAAAGHGEGAARHKHAAALHSACRAAHDAAAAHCKGSLIDGAIQTVKVYAAAIVCRAARDIAAGHGQAAASLDHHAAAAILRHSAGRCGVRSRAAGDDAAAGEHCAVIFIQHP